MEPRESRACLGKEKFRQVPLSFDGTIKIKPGEVREGAVKTSQAIKRSREVLANDVEKDFEWFDYVDGPDRDQYGDAIPLNLGYKNGKWMIDGKEKTFGAIKITIGRNLDYFLGDPLFRKIWERAKDEDEKKINQA